MKSSRTQLSVAPGGRIIWISNCWYDGKFVIIEQKRRRIHDENSDDVVKRAQLGINFEKFHFLVSKGGKVSSSTAEWEEIALALADKNSKPTFTVLWAERFSLVIFHLYHFLSYHLMICEFSRADKGWGREKFG